MHKSSWIEVVYLFWLEMQKHHSKKLLADSQNVVHPMWSYFLLICQLYKIWKRKKKTSHITSKNLHVLKEETGLAFRRLKTAWSTFCQRRNFYMLPNWLIRILQYMSHTRIIGQIRSTFVFDLRSLPKCKTFPVCLTAYFGNVHLPFFISCC